MRLLLVNPKFPESFWTFKWAIDEILPRTRATNPPLGLATLAGLCPADWEITIVDENVETVPLAPAADLIGVCGMGVQFPRQAELLRFYRSRGYKVVAGGSYASLCQERFEGLADAVVAGEAERIWPQFCADFAAGAPKALYRETGTVALTESPTPRFDLLKLERYSMASLQFSRGCPFRCEFCDIIVMFGRRPRVKSLEQVGLELDALRAQWMRRVFFVDDNFIGNRPKAKALLVFLAEYQSRHGYRFSFGTEASLNLARDAELIRLMRAAGFGWVFIGIETTDEESLKETKKTQNIGGDMLADVRRMYTSGIDVLAGFIVGFDNDTLATFDRQREFVMDSGIQSAMIGLLHAMPRTPLHERLQKEGRLRTLADDCDNTVAGTNVVPKRMEYDTMVARYKLLYRELLTDRAIGERIRNKMRHMREPLYTGGYGARDSLRIIWRLLARGVLPGGPSRWAAFLRSLPILRPTQIPSVISDWIIGLSMADFARRHLNAPDATRAAEQRVASVRAAMAGYIDAGRAELDVAIAPAPRVSLSLHGVLDRRFFVGAARSLERLLKHTPSTVTLRIEALGEAEVRHLEHLLHRLRRYGDRVSVDLNQRLRSVVSIDSSVFNLVLSRGSRSAPLG
ncbi:MAG: radical SAM protein [Lysobacterales bacterium]|nr:MAG: radical SAM protein [Xanthomonadales bacterium]